jgi:hypothetical protein
VLEFGLMEELAAFAAEMSADEDERLKERGGAEVVDLHVARHGEDVERAVELAHSFVEESGDDAAVDVAGWAFVKTVKFYMGCGDGDFRVGIVGREGEVEALWVGGATTETEAGALVEGWDASGRVMMSMVGTVAHPGEVNE